MPRFTETWVHGNALLDVEGEYEPYQRATYDEPSEGGTVELDSIKAGGVELLELLRPEVVRACERDLLFMFEVMRPPRERRLPKIPAERARFLTDLAVEQLR